MSVDEETVRRIAGLARIKLTDEAAAPMAQELSRILDWMEELGALDTTDVEPMTTAVAMSLRLREDRVTDGGYAEDVVRNAPQHDDNFFTVPKVVE